MDWRHYCFVLALTYHLRICTTASNSDFYLISMQDEHYFLSKAKADFDEATERCSDIHTGLALFDDNVEYFRVVDYLRSTSYSCVQDVWVDLNATDVDGDGGYEHFWKNEALGSNVFPDEEPDRGCKNSPDQCCARIRLEYRDGALWDKNCNRDYHFLCKSCIGGYTMDTAMTSCEDIDECHTLSNECRQTCTNTDGSYECSCDPGYVLGTDQYTCDDINECAASNICHQTCQNTVGSFQCGCYDGFELDDTGVQCLDTDECSAAQPCQQLCNNLQGSFQCQCNEGYTIGNDGTTCIDVDECQSNNPLCVGACINTLGSYYCGCPQGFDDDYGTCVDINECDHGNHNCSQLCENIIGTYNCSCHNGYRISHEDWTSCQDIDECQEGFHNCQQICTNSMGSFHCSCLEGFIADASDNATCRDINECQMNSTACEYNCINTNGSFHCSCRQGYRLDTDSASCIQIKRKCPCSVCRNTDTTEVDHVALAQKILKELEINTDELSSAQRKLNSAKDERTSSENIGFVGISFLVLVLGLIFVPDAITAFNVVMCKIKKQ